ncbi:MAG TPA: hypothetical protein VM871_02370, partial [Flavisolibacter sp.]|nr:hypothetical protein [Flavisolibacter sp.]
FLFFLYSSGYKKHYGHELELMNERLNGREPYDLLYLGSSRMCHQLNPQITDAITGLRSFNAGLDGIKLTEMNVILECYLQTHKTPEMVVIDLPPQSFNSHLFPFFNQTLYYPFLDNEIVFNNLKGHRPVGLFRHFPFFQFTEANDEMRQRSMSGLFGHRYSEPGSHYNGFNPPPDDTIGFPFKQLKGQNAPITEEGIGFLKRTIALCKARGILLMIIYPPAYKALDLELNPHFYSTAKKIADVDGVRINDYRNVFLKDDHRFFRDQTHLNKLGSDIFSRLVAQDIQDYLFENQRADQQSLSIK